MAHICNHWFRLWLGAWMVPSHYLNQWWDIVNWTVGNQHQWNPKKKLNIFIHETVFENVISKFCLTLNMLTIRDNLCHFQNNKFLCSSIRDNLCHIQNNKSLCSSIRESLCLFQNNRCLCSSIWDILCHFQNNKCVCSSKASKTYVHIYLKCKYAAHHWWVLSQDKKFIDINKWRVII